MNEPNVDSHSSNVTDENAKFSLLDELNIPEWLEDDEIEDDCSDAKSESRGVCSLSSFYKSDLSPLEGLAPDLSANVLRHLNVQEISGIATVSKAMYQAARNPDLWKLKFDSRWNYSYDDSDTSTALDWFSSYQQAYLNTHDLWITHWNCATPCDGLNPGRCCIQPNTKGDKRVSANWPSQLCPTCRYSHIWKDKEALYNLVEASTPISTPAQAIATATNLRLQQSLQTISKVTRYCPHRARQAFSRSSTLHRTISTQQYQFDSLCFLTDLLFLQVHDSIQELDDFKNLFSSTAAGTEQHPHDASETALHSWHLVHFSNPDYNRPLVWRISIQRPDCFTVYPSEGYLKPGESRVVVFGVKTLGSLISYATHQLNAHREGVDEFYANFYTEEAHLPPAPFLIHYHYASVIPCQRADDSNSLHPHPNELRDQIHLHRRPVASHIGINDERHPTHSPWERAAQPQQPIRTMYLSAHVNASQHLSEFQRSTLVPFSSIRDRRTLVACAPQLMERFPIVWKQNFENLEMERCDSIRAQAYRTESPCQICGHTWGARLEELGQAYVVRKLECEILQQKQSETLRGIYRALKQLVCALKDHHSWTERHHELCYALHNEIVNYRGTPWMSERQKVVLLQWEIVVDYICRVYASSGDHEEYYCLPWRHAGVYKHALCTNSVFGGGVCPTHSENEGANLWKEEQYYLEAFAHLAHSPGRFCLGPQEDPNHLRSHPASRYARRQMGFATDMFMDDPICGLQSALCVVSNPRSLLGHGVYDRLPYPGTLVRRPRLPILSPLLQVPCTVATTLPKLISSSKKLAYFEIQNSLDLESLVLVNSWCNPSSTLKPKSCPLSLHNYLRNIPPPGVGRFPLSREVVADDQVETIDAPKIEDLILENDEKEDVSLVSASTNATNTIEVRENEDMDFAFHRGIFNGPPLPPPNARGPRLLNLLWVLSAHLGWTVDDNQGAASVHVDRRILIGAQWLSISLMVAPLFWTLFARYARWIPATPVDYPLEALPFHVETELRFLTERECGYVSLFLLFSWLLMGRWIERHTSRDLFRAMLEHMPGDGSESSEGMAKKISSRVNRSVHRTWDAACPLFLQRMVFVPQWNRRSQSDVLKNVAIWRGRQHREHRSFFRAIAGQGLMFFENPELDLGEESRGRKLLIALFVAVGSFSASSPHFFLNLLTVFSCSISLGLSMSLQSMETGRAGVSVSSNGSMIKALSLITIIIIAFLLGQLVGSSGGVLFVAEFVVTSISLVLGGAGTISASAMESWGTFFVLALTSFWGYLFGRVAVMEGIRKKRSGFSSVMLCISLCGLVVLWIIALGIWKWEVPVQLVISRPLIAQQLRNLGRRRGSREDL